MTLDLSPIKKALEEATPGPWVPYEGLPREGAQMRHGPDRTRVVLTYAEADLLCLLRNSAPELIREVEGLRAESAVNETEKALSKNLYFESQLEQAQAQLRDLRARLFEERAKKYEAVAFVQAEAAKLLEDTEEFSDRSASEYLAVECTRRATRFRSIAAKIRKGEM